MELECRHLAPQDVLDFGNVPNSIDGRRARKDSKPLFGGDKELLDVRDNAIDKIDDKLIIWTKDRHSTLQPPQRILEGLVTGLRLTDDGRQPMNKSQDHSLRNEAWATQWHDYIRIGMH